jgi:isoleucyl-tRNA synthetase
MIKQVQSTYNPAELEKKIQENWIRNSIYKKVKELRSGGADFYFVDGPPYTTGSIHLGTAWNKSLKDTIIRYKRMQRFNVRDQPGYDMHGLPIEVKVEQSIGVKSKKEIEDYGIDKFVSTCKNFALDFQKRMTEQFKELGVWMDWENPYLTISPEYVEAAWWTLRRAFDKGLLVSANRVLSWCPRCETALAEAEIEYWDESDPSIYVKFPLRDEEGVSLLIWTTTPWTLLANMAVAVHPDFSYAKVTYSRRDGKEKETVILLEDLAEEVGALADWDAYEISELIEGDDLVGIEYLTPFHEDVPHQREITGKWAHRVIPSSTVVAENTGLVHIAPGHGPEDFEIGQEFGLEAFCPVDETGRFGPEVGEKFAGMQARKANADIVQALREKRLIFYDHSMEHRYGHCWRCDSPIIYRTTSQWFLRVTQIRDMMLEEIDKVRWTPDWAGSSREYDWAVNARDWCISRQRYWGIPLPIWKCQCGEMKVVGSVNELRGAEGFREGMELHRPWIDAVTLKCDRCSGRMKRVPDVLDVWFDSGVSTWAQLGFPGSRKELDRWWPAKWITEAHDQTRGWFYSQLAAGCIGFDRAPYESVLMHGWILDPQGQPMSKSRGNVIEPSEIITEHGADALRFYLMKANAPWEDISFQREGVKNARRTLNVLWNVCNFATTYMSIDHFDPLSVDYSGLASVLRPEDKWLISRNEKLKNEVAKHLESFELHKACRSLEEFILDDLSRWYVRLIRDRMWREEGDLDKTAAYKVLHESLLSVSKLLAPFCPHITEEIYQNIDGSKGSIHMLDWPAPDLTKADDRLEGAMSLVKEIVEIVTRERQSRGVKLRWPLRRIAVKTNTRETLDSLKTLETVLISQANLKVVEFVNPDEVWKDMILSVIPNPLAIGKVYRQWSSKIAILLKSRPAAQIKDSVEKGEYSLGVEGQMIKIEPNMVSFTTSLPSDVTSVKFSGGEIYIDFHMTPDIEAEGFARDLIRRIQQMRKDMDLDVEEFITAKVKASTKLIEFFKVWKDHIAKETRSKSITFTEQPGGESLVSWEVEGESIEVGVTSLHTREAIGQFSAIPGLSRDSALSLVEAGYKSPSDLKSLSEDAIAAIRGVSKNDARKIAHYLLKIEIGPEQNCPECGKPFKEGAATCPSCGKDLVVKGGSMPKEKLIPYLLRIPRMNKIKAELLYDAGFDSIEKIESSSKDDIRRVKGIGAKTAEKVVAYALAGGFENQVSCDKCGTDIPPDVLKCPSCGADAPSEILEEGEAEEETEANGIEDYKLEASFTYLIKEEKAERAYAFFVRALSEGMKGFCVTRNYPLKIKAKHNIGDIPVIWLTNVGKENTLRPKDLEKLSVSLEQFISAANTGKGSIVLLDGLEYLITNNNFLTVLRFVQSFRDQIAIKNAVLLMALNPSTLEPHELNLLEKEVDVTF